VLLACWLAVRLRIGALARGLAGRHLLVLGTVAGVGFTMALFVGQMAFDRPELLASAKLGVLAGSAVAAVLGLLLGRLLLSPVGMVEVARSADEAESSTER
jgi:NhaA family Na+:H+ antiporter